MIEVLNQPALTRGREVEGCDQRGKQADVANADVRCGKSVKPGCFEPKRKDFRIRRGRIGAPEGLDPGLQEFAGPIAAMTEDRAEIAEALRLAGRGRGKVVTRDRDLEVGPQTELAALPVGGEIHAFADVL